MDLMSKEDADINPLIPILNKHINDLCITETRVTGFIDGEGAFDQFRTDLAAAGCTYATRSSDKLESKFLFSAKKGDVPINFFEYPFQVLSVVHYDCSQGGTYIPRKTILEEGDPERKRRKLFQPTKKIGCKAKFVCKKIRVFPDYTVPRNHWMPKRSVLKQLRYDLQHKGGIRMFIRYYLSMTAPNSHNHPMKLSSLSLNLNKDLIEKIYELVNSNIVSVKEIKQHLIEKVNMMFEGSTNKPDLNNSAFFPNEKTIRNHVYKALVNKNRYKLYSSKGDEAVSHCELVISMDNLGGQEEEEERDSVEGQLIDYLKDKCETNLKVLNQISYLIQDKSHLEELAKDLKECIAKHKGSIKRRNAFYQLKELRELIQLNPESPGGGVPSSSSSSSLAPTVTHHHFKQLIKIEPNTDSQVLQHFVEKHVVDL